MYSYLWPSSCAMTTHVLKPVTSTNDTRDSLQIPSFRAIPATCQLSSALGSALTSLWNVSTCMWSQFLSVSNTDASYMSFGLWRTPLLKRLSIRNLYTVYNCGVCERIWVSWGLSCGKSGEYLANKFSHNNFSQ